MRHLLTLAIASLNLTTDFVKSTQKHFLSKAVKNALIGLAEEISKCDNIVEVNDAMKELEESMDNLSDESEEFVDELKDEFRALGLL